MKKIIISFSLIIVFFSVFSCPNNKKSNIEIQDLKEKTLAANKNWKVLHIMSYHSPWKWTDDQLNGFKEVLKDLDIEYQIFQMDTKNRSSEQWKQKVGKQARQLIETWKPDLVYLNDDAAQQYITKYYIDQDIPFVFSGVNATPKEYGFSEAKNITGVLEREHFVETVKLLKEIVPNINRVGVIIDDDPTWIGVIDRMRNKFMNFPEIEFEIWDIIHTFNEYKQKITDSQGNIDAIALLGIFTFKDEEGNNVPYTKVLKWTTLNSQIPDFTFWKDRISYGTLCAVTVSGYEQGYAVGNIARSILLEDSSASEIPIKSTIKGEPVISLARANSLNIKVQAGILLSVEVIEKYQWEE